jgi:hypothetical protein
MIYVSCSFSITRLLTRLLMCDQHTRHGAMGSNPIIWHFHGCRSLWLEPQMRVKDLLVCGWGICLFTDGGFSRLPQYLFVDGRATTSFPPPPEPDSVGAAKKVCKKWCFGMRSCHHRMTMKHRSYEDMILLHSLSSL